MTILSLRGFTAFIRQIEEQMGHTNLSQSLWGHFIIGNPEFGCLLTGDLHTHNDMTQFTHCIDLTTARECGKVMTE